MSLSLALALAVGACGDKKPAEQGTAAGEVLPGSISDAMLPLDSVRSEPPLADPVEAGGGDGKLDKSKSGKGKGKGKAEPAGALSEPAEPDIAPSAPAEPSAAPTAE